MTCEAFDAMGFNHENTTVVSGIGCTGRIAGYFALDSMHGLHGRAIPVAEGMRVANKNLNVVVVSGDGDLLGIGGNHLLHALRRNTNISVFCSVNEIYGMTGGQKSPTTRLDARTVSTPHGSKDIPINIQAIVKAHGNFYARTTSYHLNHMKKSLIAALKYEGLSFVEIRVPCPINFGRRVGYTEAYDMLMDLKSEYKIKDGAESLGDDEIGITK
jgi:2-oxoglutarate ferredoxin oxidoreductase subunit beta